jgi:hypothetical protein
MGRKKEPTPSLAVYSIGKDTHIPGDGGANATEETPIDVAIDCHGGTHSSSTVGGFG